MVPHRAIGVLKLVSIQGKDNKNSKFTKDPSFGIKALKPMKKISDSEVVDIELGMKKLYSDSNSLLCRKG